MEVVLEFRYLGRLLMETDDDWLAVSGNTQKARVRWGRLARALGRGGGGPESVTEFLHCCDTAGPPIWGGDTGPHKEDGVSPGRLPGQNCEAVNMETA